MANPGQVGAFVNTTQVWDVAQLYQVDVTTPEFKELLVRMYQQLNAVALAINVRDAGFYDTHEFVNGQLYFPNPIYNSTTPVTAALRQVMRKVINFGSLPAAGSKSVAHNITLTPVTTFTRIYGAASNPTTNMYIPLPYASASGIVNNLELKVSGANVVITTGGTDYSGFTTTYVVLEYLQS